MMPSLDSSRRVVSFVLATLALSATNSDAFGILPPPVTTLSNNYGGLLVNSAAQQLATTSTSLLKPSLQHSSSSSFLVSSSSLFGGDNGIFDILRLDATKTLINLPGAAFMSILVVLLILRGLGSMIPVAAKELERDCIALSPELWSEYQAKIRPGETIDQRPKLMAELIPKVEALVTESRLMPLMVTEEEKGVEAEEGMESTDE